MIEFLQAAGTWVGFFIVWLLCAAGVILSCVSISGTWVVAAATVLAAFLSRAAFPGWGTVVVFLLLSGAVEGIEAVAGAWGVKKRGGSDAAGFAALGGGLLGLLLGGLLPLPFIGPLLGMLAGSFALAYWVEKRRLMRADHAAHVAWGAVWARLLVVLVKLTVTLGMISYLVLGFVLG